MGNTFLSDAPPPPQKADKDDKAECNFSACVPLLLTQFQTHTGAPGYMILTQVFVPLPPYMWPLLFNRQRFLSGRVSHSHPDSNQLWFCEIPRKPGIRTGKPLHFGF